MGTVHPLRTRTRSPRPGRQPLASPTPPPALSWQDFLSYFYGEWKQGEHVTLIGPTGSGKTTLALRLLPRRSYVAILACKPKDTTMDEVLRAGYTRMKVWSPDISDHAVLWPEVGSINSIGKQKEVFRNALHSVYRSGGWALYIDEATYLSDFLGLKKELSMLWQQGRSLGVSLVAGTQRPAYIPLYAYDQATHLFFWRDNDRVNLQRASNLGGMDASFIRDVISSLEKHEVLYVNTRTGERYTTKPEV